MLIPAKENPYLDRLARWEAIVYIATDDSANPLTGVVMYCLFINAKVAMNTRSFRVNAEEGDNNAYPTPHEVFQKKLTWSDCNASPLFG